MLTTNDFCKKEYGTKLYKISFDAGFSCPNRDGKIATGGCIFCSNGGSGDFAVKLYDEATHNMLSAEAIEEQIVVAKQKVAKKYKGDKYIAYFQAFTNTYADVDTLRNIYMPIIKRDDIAVLSIATRPDCLNNDIYTLLDELNSIKPVWVELGLQTTKQSSIEYIRRGYDTSVYDEAIVRLNDINIHTITHIILYLPNETCEDMLESVRHAISVGTKGIKLQLLHIIKGTQLANIYTKEPFDIATLPEYADMVKRCVDIIPESIVIHRLTGDPPKRILIEPKWAADKKNVLNTINDTINPPSDYYVYILECGDGSYYTGSTNDVIKRFTKHVNGIGCKYTASHHPTALAYVEICPGKRAALKREYAIKQLSHKEKAALIASDFNKVSLFLR